MLASPRRLRVRRLRHMRLEPGSRDLLHHIPPTRAALHRQRHLAVGSTSDLPAEPPTKPTPVWLPDPAPPLLARLDLDPVEGDLSSVQIQPTYHRHQAPSLIVNRRLADQMVVRTPSEEVLTH
jgi:hypothetical protein